MKSVLVTGGAGYVGCVLVPKLLAASYSVTAYDLMLYGSVGLPAHPHLEIVKADVRDTRRFTTAVKDVDTVIHLACISNDPSFELNPALSRSINYDCFEPMVQACKSSGVRRFIYASTSSVYGVSDAPEVTEDHPLIPITDYNRYKGMCEPVLLRYQAPGFSTVAIRCATVCGYSPRMRLDLTVNILTNHAVHRGVITVFGGNQKRPNIHVDDITDLYLSLVAAPEQLIAGEIFNAVHKNHTVSELAEIVRRVVEEEMPEKAPIRVEACPSNDPRSYHISGRKIKAKLDFTPERSIENAVRDLCAAFRAGKIPNSLEDDRYVNVQRMKRIGLL